VDGLASRFAFARGRKCRAGRDGRNGVSRKLGSWGPCGCS
jgi:hypothetical protein